MPSLLPLLLLHALTPAPTPAPCPHSCPYYCSMPQFGSEWRKVSKKLEGEDAYEELDKDERMEVWEVRHGACRSSVECALWTSCCNACLCSTAVHVLQGQATQMCQCDPLPNTCTAAQPTPPNTEHVIFRLHHTPHFVPHFCLHTSALHFTPSHLQEFQRELERREREEREREREEKRRQERKARDAFKDFLDKQR